MSTTEGPTHFPLEKTKKLRGRPKKSLPISEPEPEPVPVNSGRSVPFCSERGTSETRTAPSGRVFGAGGVGVVEPETIVNSGHPPGVGVEEPKKNRRKKYGSAQEVFDGSFLTTKSGLKKEDLVLTPKGKLMSKTRYQNLVEAGKRLLRSREA
jgi:hypothetical protein